jgi:hypothetical protein
VVTFPDPDNDGCFEWATPAPLMSSTEYFQMSTSKNAAFRREALNESSINGIS